MLSSPGYYARNVAENTMHLSLKSKLTPLNAPGPAPISALGRNAPHTTFQSSNRAQLSAQPNYSSIFAALRSICIPFPRFRLADLTKTSPMIESISVPSPGYYARNVAENTMHLSLYAISTPRNASSVILSLNGYCLASRM
jgi:hypothetical protein